MPNFSRQKKFEPAFNRQTCKICGQNFSKTRKKHVKTVFNAKKRIKLVIDLFLAKTGLVCPPAAADASVGRLCSTELEILILIMLNSS
jgi:hypothetical protein